jgi:IPT/TIG domain
LLGENSMNKFLIGAAIVIVMLLAFLPGYGQQKENPRVYTQEDLKKVKLNDLKDTDIIVIGEKRYTIAELKDMEQKSFNLLDEVFIKHAEKTQKEMQEYRNIEDYKNKSRVDKIRKEIQIILEKEKKEKSKKNTSACTDPAIYSVYPTTVYPGDPILIKGCKFGEQPRMILISDKKIPLVDEQWSENAIIATLPKLRGFADPYYITLQVSTIKGEMSNLSNKILLQPNMSFMYLDNKDFMSIGVDPQKCYYSGEADQFRGVFYFAHSYFIGIDDPACAYGVDTVARNMTLKNYWIVYAYSFVPYCFSINSGNYDINFCSDINYAKLVENLENLIGKSYIPKISVSWSGNTAFFGSIILYGPEGTNP